MLSTKTSLMAAVTSPVRWSFEIVDVVFGSVRPRRNQTLAMKGDLIRDMETGEVFRLGGREGDVLIIEEL